MPDRVVDLRSDTVTEPTEEMREAMRNARVGDDVYGEDPTVNELEEMAAKSFGMEAALFFPSGTMANEAAIMVHTRRRGEIIVERESHIHLFELGGPATLSGVQTQTIAGARGVFTARQLAEAIRDPTDDHVPPTTLVSVENTHNLAGGTVWTPEQTRAVVAVAHENRVPVHVDGARIFNSAVAQEVPVASLVKGADSVMFSLSKGLSAPVGSLLCGSEEFIHDAHRARKLLGGGMRQVGVLAAAGRVALEKMVDRLRDDHTNARRLAVGLSKIPGLKVNLDSVQTNIVFVDFAEAPLGAKQFEARLAALGVKAIALDPRRMRLVTHRHVTAKDVDWVLGQAAAVFSAPAARPRRKPAK